MKESDSAAAQQPEISEMPPVPTSTVTGRRLVVAAVAAYASALVVAFATGHYAFIPKEALIPAFLLIPALAGRLRAFVAEWSVFLALIIFFDALRGLVFALVTAFDLPVYMAYAADADRALLGDSFPAMLQQAFLKPTLGWAEYALIVVHASHFLVFLLFGMVVWFWRRETFPLFAASFITLIYAGLVGYLAIPTVPPWMASGTFETIAPVRHVTAEVYNTAMPAFFRGFDTNPIAAMPSMHTAIPVLIAIFGLRSFGRYAAPLVAYAIAVIASITYLGEHYLVDVFAGIALAVLVDQLVHRVLAPKIAHRTPLPARTRGLVAVLLVVATFAVGKLNFAIGGGWIPSRSFVAGELEGRSPLAPYYRGYYALEDGDPTAALAALDELEPRFVDGHVVRMQALAEAALGDPKSGFERLRTWGIAHPEDPQPLFWATKLAFEGKLITAAQVSTVSAQLRNGFGAVGLADELDAMIDAAP